MKKSRLLLFCLCAVSFGTSAFARNVTELPLTDVILYSSGVGFFAHQGCIEKDASIRFRMTREQLNDLLKSLYVTASGDGIGIKSVTYPTEMPLTALLEGYRINVTGIHSLSDILRQLSGADFEGTRVSGAAFRGKLISVETKKVSVRSDETDRTEDVEYALLLTGSGIQRIPVADFTSIVPVDKTLLAEMTKALTILAEQRDKSVRPVDINLAAKKPAEVRVAYVIESPVWKASYRLELGEKAGDKAHLQGWALVENPTGTEWKNVRLSLISGRPVSFIQDLYTSLYLPRPRVERERYENILPARHEIAPRLGKKSKYRNASDPECEMMVAGCDAVNDDAAPAFERVTGEMETQHGAMGELYCYQIASPVTLGSRQSAMLELVSAEIPADKVSYYSMESMGKRPLNSVILKNSGTILLPQGPVTIFDGEKYGGDASLSDLAAGQEQILSYGIDLEVIARPCHVSLDNEISNLVIDRGTVDFISLRTTTYTCNFTNQSGKDKMILFEIPKQDHEKISNNVKPFSETAGTCRFLLPVKAGENYTAKVQLEKVIRNTVSVNINSDFSGFVFTSANAKLSRDSREVADKLLAYSRKLKDLRQELKNIEAKIRDLSATHDRTRNTLNGNIAQDLRTRLNQRLSKTDEALDKQYQLKNARIAEIGKAEKEFSEFLNARTASQKEDVTIK